MQANTLIAHLEGLFSQGNTDGFFSRSTAADAKLRQTVGSWLQCLKIVMRGEKQLREATDWNIVQTSDAVNADAELDASGGTIYGYFIDSIYDVAGENLCVLIGDVASGGGQTLDAIALDAGGEGGENGNGFYIKLDVASATAPEYAMGVFPDGIVMTESIQAMADGEEGTAPTANDVRVWIVYRSDAEVKAS